MTPDSPSRWVGGDAARNGWGIRQGIHSPEDRRFVGVTGAALDDYLARNPIEASAAGDVRFDARLPDYSEDGVAEQVRVLNRHLLALDSIDPVGLSRANAVDLTILRQRLTARVYRLRTLDEPTWNPAWWSPALSLEPLLARRKPPVQAVLARLRGIGEHLDSARHTLTVLPRPHVQHALVELGCTPAWLTVELKALADANPRWSADLLEAGEEAIDAVLEHRQWLAARLPQANRDPRLGTRTYAEALRHVLGVPCSVDEIRRWAEEDVEELTELLRSTAAQVLGRSMASRRLVPTALAAVADEHALEGVDLIPAARRSVAAAREFVLEHALVSVPDLELDVAAMSPVRSGLVSAYSEPPGAFASLGERARVVVSGPDPAWPPSRRKSFLREYNAVMLDALMGHQAIPGHALQAVHARQASAPTSIRSVFPDELFVEGWAVYAQQLLTEHGYKGSVPGATPAQFALQEVKLRLRGAVNALLEIGFHAGDTDEPQARRLLATAAMAEEGESMIRWRRVLTDGGSLTSQLVGRRLITDLVADVQRKQPSWSLRQVHDRLLVNGAIPPTHARDLLGAQ